MTKFVALVCRISEDKTGRVEGVKAQERWGRTYAARTWPGLPIRVYADNDRSASDDTPRPEFERFRTDVAAGHIAHVWAVEQSRLERREIEWFVLAAELDAAGIDEVHTNRDGIVRVRDVTASIKAVLNADEVRKLKRRVNDRLDENAANGRPAGSRPYGYVHGVNDRGEKTLIVVDEEAAVIREAADRFLSGWSLTNIARDLTNRGVTGPYRVKVTASGKRYTRSRADEDPVLTVDGTPLDDGGTPVTRPGRITMNSVRSWLTSPTVAGRRVHRGEVNGRGNWPAILDAATYAAVKAKLAGPRAVVTVTGETVDLPAPHRHTPPRRYLLSGGVVVCGVCRAPLVGTLKQRRSKRDKQLVRSVPYYSCHPKGGGRGCVGVLAEPLEELVVNVLLARLDTPAMRRALADDEHAERRSEILTGIDAIDEELAELARMLGAREMTPDEWRIAKATAIQRQQNLRSALVDVPPSTATVDPDGIRQGWDLMTLDERREIVTMFVATIAVGRATPGLQGFEPARLAPVETWWRA